MVKIKSASRLQTGLLVFSLAFLFIIVVCPMFALFSKAFHANDGTFIGLANFVEYFSSPHLVRSLKNSLVISTAVAAVATVLAFVYAYALTRALVPAKKLLRFTAVLPLFAPTMMYGIALVYLIGNKGIITMAGLKLPLYGPLGIFISEVFYTFPQAFLILSITLAYCDNRLYEAARVMGTSAWRIFRTVTLPGAKFGIVSAFLVAFTLCFTDFGAPKVVGGNYSVLATDIYKQVVGQQNFGMGAGCRLLLMIPALVMFAADRFISSANDATVSSRSVSYRILENKLRDRALTLFCVVINIFIFMLAWRGLLRRLHQGLALQSIVYSRTFPRRQPSDGRTQLLRQQHNSRADFSRRGHGLRLRQRVAHREDARTCAASPRRLPAFDNPARASGPFDRHSLHLLLHGGRQPLRLLSTERCG